MSALQARELRKVYGGGENGVDAVRGVSLELTAGECVAVVGPSGCGKSTLLHLCGGMDRPTAGTVVVDGVPLAGLGDDGLTQLRRERVGFVFQFFNLLPTLTLVENIALPLLLAGVAAGRGPPRPACAPTGSGWGIACTTIRPRCPAVNCSGRRWLVPWCIAPRYSLPTSRRATSIRTTATAFSPPSAP